MPLETSGTLSIGGSTTNRSINLEFGRTATQTTAMSQLYRNGGIVGAGAPNVPTSGTISISQFYGAANNFTFNRDALLARRLNYNTLLCCGCCWLANIYSVSCDNNN